MQRLNAAPWLLVALFAQYAFSSGAPCWATTEAANPQNETVLQSVDSSPQPGNYNLKDGFDDLHYGPWQIIDAPPQEQAKPQDSSAVAPAETAVPESKAGAAPPAAPAGAPTIDPQVIELARGGDAVAQYKLGYAYYLGHGLTQDFAQAAIWWQKAAEQGYPQAQNNLGVLYNAGKGVPQSYSEAYFWQNLSAARTNGTLQAQFAKNRDESAARLSIWERQRVQKRASKWAAEHPVTPKPAEESAGKP